ncbi:MAG: hypothetical protein WBA46_09465 [Thermomicrobiales bacterium]
MAEQPWPTPRASENENRQTKPTPSQLAGTHGKSLAAEAATRPWPTPTQDSATERSARYAQGGTPLTLAVQTFPTPNAGDNWDRGYAEMPAIKRRIENGQQVMLSMQVQQQKGQKLHGRWTLALMGFPPDWCDDLPPDPMQSGTDGRTEAGKTASPVS